LNLSLDAISLVLAGLLGAVVSGNNLSACCGTIIGSRMVNRRSGILISVAGYLLGLSIEGPKLFRVRQAFLPTETSTQVFSILLATLLIFIGGELTRIPLSLSKALTGTILGVSFAIGTLHQNDYLILILIFWVSAPIVATALGLLFVSLDNRYSPRNLWVKLSLLNLQPEIPQRVLLPAARCRDGGAGESAWGSIVYYRDGFIRNHRIWFCEQNEGHEF